MVKLPQIKTHKFRAHSLTFRGSIQWKTLSDDIKRCENVAAVTSKIKNLGRGQTAAVNYVVNRTLYFLLDFYLNTFS